MIALDRVGKARARRRWIARVAAGTRVHRGHEGHARRDVVRDFDGGVCHGHVVTNTPERQGGPISVKAPFATICPDFIRL